MAGSPRNALAGRAVPDTDRLPEELPPTRAVSDLRASPPSATATPENLPESFGRYHILRKLGKGGMGTVYLAHDTELDRPVALKVPHYTEADGSDVLERFHREARAAATLRHANICPVYDVGTISGVPYLTMACIDGKPLTIERPWSERDAAALVHHLTLALEYAHQQGIVHRDLKPANIMITPEGEPVIMDFGLARRDRPQEPLLTQEGKVLGTPAYMAPEQAIGDVAAQGPGCDIYSLGVILYQLLTSRVPFLGTPLKVIASLVKDEPPSPQILRPTLDPRLTAICLKALAKKPGDRHVSMAAFRSALAGFLDQQSTTVPRMARKWLTGTAGAALLGLLAYAAVLMWGRPPTPSPIITERGSNEQVLEKIVEHARTVSEADRRYVRYFSLNHLLTGHLPRAELQRQREAFAKVLTDLSTTGETRILTPVDEPTGSVFAVDLRRLGWDRRLMAPVRAGKAPSVSVLNVFDLVLLEYPYGVVPTSSSEFAALAEEFLGPAAQVRPNPYVRADWFVSACVQQPLVDDFQRILGRTPLHEPLEPVIATYRDVPVTLDTATAELGGVAPDELRRAIATPPVLVPDLADGMPRSTWEREFEHVVRRLGLGVPLPPLDGLMHPVRQPPALTVELRTNKPDNVFAPDEALEVRVTNHSGQPLFIELMGTSARGEKVLLVPSSTQLAAGATYRFPPSGRGLRVKAGSGREQITLFAAAEAFPSAELLRGQGIADRVVHPFGRLERQAGGTWRVVDDPSSAILKQVISVETR